MLLAQGQTEDYLRASGIPHTILAPNGYMEAMVGGIAGMPALMDKPVTIVGGGSRKHSFISAGDVAAFIIAAIGNPAVIKRPFHPERNFIGQAGVRKNWSFFFATMTDYRVEILSEAVEGDTLWAELHFHGTQVDGTKHSTRGVTLSGIQMDQIAWTRLYIETVLEPAK